MKHNLKLPVSEEDILKMKSGDIVYLSGIIITARDQAHKRIIDYIQEDKSLPESFSELNGSAIYHCGPIIKECENSYEIISGGPTTSARMEDYENDVVKHLGIKFIIGKGGMKQLDTKSLKVVYLSYTGGCGAIINQKIEQITNVVWKDLGICEAIWFLEVKNFGPLIVAQDIYGKSLYKK